MRWGGGGGGGELAHARACTHIVACNLYLDAMPLTSIELRRQSQVDILLFKAGETEEGNFGNQAVDVRNV